MKQLIFTLLILMAITLLGAVSYDETMRSFFAAGHSGEIDGDTYWIMDDVYSNRDDALKKIVKLAALFVRRDSDEYVTSIPEFNNVFDSTDYIFCRWSNNAGSSYNFMRVPVLYALLSYYAMALSFQTTGDLEKDLYDMLKDSALIEEWEAE
ncbi:MAG: hypothetical protein GX122_01255 [Candidatus Cloacimonetes bacterium]|nr:hypothetical protein [Candidatus Cloacimonadota bacterium]